MPWVNFLSLGAGTKIVTMSCNKQKQTTTKKQYTKINKTNNNKEQLVTMSNNEQEEREINKNEQ